MASRFIEADENKNTKRRTEYWTGVFPKWAKTRGRKEQLESYEIQQLNKALSQSYAVPRNENGQEYEPE